MSLARVTPTMIRHIDPNADLNTMADQIDELIRDLEKWEKQGNCPHKPSNLVVKATGDMAHKANGTICRYCTQRIRVKEVVWESEDIFPMPPRAP